MINKIKKLRDQVVEKKENAIEQAKNWENVKFNNLSDMFNYEANAFSFIEKELNKILNEETRP